MLFAVTDLLLLRAGFQSPSYYPVENHLQPPEKIRPKVERELSGIETAVRKHRC